MEKNILNTLRRDEVFAKIKPFLSSCPSKKWLMDHLTTFEPTPTSSFYCIYSGHTVYKLTPAALYNGKEDFLNDIFDRWVKAVNNGEFSVHALGQGKENPSLTLYSIADPFPYISTVVRGQHGSNHH